MDDEGLIRAHGCLENARILPKDTRNPVVLPRDHQLTILLLCHLHHKRGHCGYKSLMHEARRKYWIIVLRKMAKAVVSSCVPSRELRRKPLDGLMGQVPSLRVAAGFPAIFEPGYGYVRATADQVKPKNTTRSRSCDLCLYNHQSYSPRALNR